ncbi:11395_t:CDS:2 [Funneliformis caledonium]|uniref:11395_t:CDS:1 n=1 Tax=Funneliformis caledonium TaxID=1117310 RepID=A0A9N9H2B3_9GLOM|nr:11395_t:CDS:2 [Funneliformis caledonium]
MAKVWYEYFNENDVEAWSIFHFQQNWKRIHEGDYKQLSYDKANDALTKSLRAIINKSLDTKRKLRKLIDIANVKRMLRRNMNSKNIDTGNYLQFSSCSDVRIESVSTGDPVNGQKRKKESSLPKDKKLIDISASKKVKNNDNKAEGSASYVKDTLSSSSLETVAETESSGLIEMLIVPGT